MNKNISNNTKLVNWECLPESATLLKYLDRDQVLELGKCCKRYRKQFEKIIFDNLNLTSYLNQNKEIIKELKISKDYDKLARAIKEDFGDKVKLVKKFKFNDLFCLGVVEKVAELLPNVNNILFNIPNCFDCDSHSLAFVSGMKNLEYVEYTTYRPEFHSINLKNVIFSKSLKSITIKGYPEYFANIYVFDEIYPSYATNLSTLSISSNKMLANFTPLPSLKEIRIHTDYGLEKPLILEFFKKNPQLKKIELGFEVSEELLQIILSFKYLNYLYIYGTDSDLLGYNNYHNNSIKKLKLGGLCYGSKAIKIINSCQNIENLIFNGMESVNFNTTRWMDLKVKIKKLELQWFWHSKSVIETLDIMKLFDEIKFTDCTSSLDVERFQSVILTNYTFHSSAGYNQYYSMKIINK